MNNLTMKLIRYVNIEKGLFRKALGEAMKIRDYHTMSPGDKHRLVMAHYYKLIRDGEDGREDNRNLSFTSFQV